MLFLLANMREVLGLHPAPVRVEFEDPYAQVRKSAGQPRIKSSEREEPSTIKNRGTSGLQKKRKEASCSETCTVLCSILQWGVIDNAVNGNYIEASCF